MFVHSVSFIYLLISIAKAIIQLYSDSLSLTFNNSDIIKISLSLVMSYVAIKH